MRRFFHRFWNALWPQPAERQAAREISAHAALLEAELRRRGITPKEAQLQARRRLGGIDQVRERHRDARSFVWLEDARRDVQYALRALARNPGFTLAAVLTLAIGIGGSSAVLSLINVVLVRPLPFREPERLVMVWEDASDIGFQRNDVAPPNYAALVSYNQVFESVAAATGWSGTLAGGSEPELIEGHRVTANLFPALGVTPALGRVFRADEDRPGGPAVTILSHRLWQRRFNGDPTIVGRAVLLNDEPYIVVGVMPPGFQFLDSNVELWVPAAFGQEELTHGSNYLTVVARLRADVSLQQAQVNVDAVTARIRQERPVEERRLRAYVLPLSEQLTGDARRPLLVLLLAVGAVLLIVCANLASLLLARAASRRHEIALRGALGATRSRVVRQLLTESLVLAAAGLVLGVVLARWTLAFLQQLVPPSMTLFTQVALDKRTLAVTVILSTLTGVLLGLAPALRMTRLDLSEALKLSRRTTSGTQRGRSVLVVAQVAMTLVLLVAAGLLVHTLYRLRYADLGFRPASVLTLRTALAGERYADHARRTVFYDEVLERVSRLPGVVEAGYTTSVPLAWKGATASFAIEGQARDPGVAYDATHRQISAHYFSTMGIPLRRGRYFVARDAKGTRPVAIVNEMMARQYWPGEDVVGKRFKVTDGGPGSWLTIVGVVGDVRQLGLDAPVKVEMYVPYRQFDAHPWFAPRDLVVRTVGDPMDFVASIKHEIHAVDPTQPISDVGTLNNVLDQEVAARRVGTTLLIAFAAFALLLAVVGIYGVIAYFVVQHIPEIGVRIALGAQPRDILLLVAGKGVKLALIGVGLGVIAAVAATRLMSSLLYGVSGFNPIMIGLGGVLLLVLALVASYLPARRAIKLDPIIALRSE